MSLIKKIFGGSSVSNEEKKLPWVGLTNTSQLNFIEEQSKTKPQLIFKHSTRCGISSMVLNQFVDNYNFAKHIFDIYYLDLLGYRDVSNEIAIKFQVMHQSPQILVVKNGVVVAHDSHGAINDLDLNQFI